MTLPEKHIVIALTVSATLVLFNIVAVTSGAADNYYSQIGQILTSVGSLLH